MVNIFATGFSRASAIFAVCACTLSIIFLSAGFFGFNVWPPIFIGSLVFATGAGVIAGAIGAVVLAIALAGVVAVLYAAVFPAEPNAGNCVVVLGAMDFSNPLPYVTLLG